ncbi:DUF3108 domain-containing protein [Rugamonas sp. DEMB1]|uniref:DUF3108 domain-containing protein n=1 Tax=Rugamonas sp. DEMB1 TaxID=3039386 RepID=UPI002449312D|nr:DUF3108 domain-containing protein [Rugamonas sp. DEMB1]WGG49948.1 DUF3108 domain-containing protein [Rugamonas sp. DEMB1]
MAIDWVGGRLGPPDSRRPAAMAPVTAQLRLALPQRAPSAPLPEVAPLAPGAVKRARKAAPKPAAAAPEPATAEAAQPTQTQTVQGADVEAAATSATSADAADNAENAATPAPATAAAPAAQPQAGAAPAQSPVPSAPEAADMADKRVALPEAAPPGMRRYKVNLPPSADFELDVKRVDANGTTWSGVAVMAWHSDGSRYKLNVEAGLSMLVTRINLLVLSSEGMIDDYGIAPVTATEKVRGRSQTATHFNRDEGRITFSASERSYPLLVGTQDKATVPFQLGGIGRADHKQFGGDIDLQVGEDKDANIFRFQLVGEEELETRMGKLSTWHLTRPPRPGTYSSRIDIWLAPGLSWYPVQIRNTEASGALTTQTVSKITVIESGH